MNGQKIGTFFTYAERDIVPIEDQAIKGFILLILLSSVLGHVCSNNLLPNGFKGVSRIVIVRVCFSIKFEMRILIYIKSLLHNSQKK